MISLVAKKLRPNPFASLQVDEEIGKFVTVLRGR